jgi:hypothetical protein
MQICSVLVVYNELNAYRLIYIGLPRTYWCNEQLKYKWKKGKIVNVRLVILKP